MAYCARMVILKKEGFQFKIKKSGTTKIQE